ncbi:acyl-CoA dehydrogenase family protein [Legionella maceachernii]|uniref:Short chain-specific acyl CoA dehydrogenase n=1 Tax=Legionella maceachernii TaxID=466 RepID=A0A0W0W8X6_9GAMM|nr:acyl-CoA dehydrogenase family protein [Legionella maceachernii]KTD28797.1 short chain-specific acyl CoA dehydrogenase [Legionella maceachernii]SJZ71326.1 Acyl-CoA dehydrogenase, middle domain [Legionella maceachernii]SUP02349.1 Putative acyl-CoA dehydrogenase AidB [Legionella maceachernii]
MNETNAYEQTRDYLNHWNQQLKDLILTEDSNLLHTYQCYYIEYPEFMRQLRNFAHRVAYQLEPLVMENNLDANLPKVEHYNSIGEREDRVIHHPAYETAGNIIYGSDLMHYLLQPGQMHKSLSLFFLSSHAGEAGHNCPIACSAGVIRVLKNYCKLAETSFYLDKLTQPSYSQNYTGAQFLTEIQGGSDVGVNATQAYQDDLKAWRITGEKWFCSNANADLILATARYDQNISGTKGLGLFLIPSRLPDGKPNQYKLRRLKQKIGTRSMATAEIEFEDALAYPMGELYQGIHLALENVLHVSRLFNAFSVLGMARRAFQTAYYYALNRRAFNHKIIDYPLVKETLAHIKAENTALIASIFYMANCQDELDTIPYEEQPKEKQLLMRTLANLNKYFTAKRSVENIHHCIDILAGNGTIESFSSLPRLLRDCIVCENWEGTHFTLWMQTLRDIEKFKVDELFLDYLHQLFNQLTNHSEHKAFIKEKMNDLSNAINTMKTMPSATQSLHIQTIVEQMAILHAALALALEIETVKPPKSKEASLTLFINHYFRKDYRQDSHYLALLNAVLGKSPS